MTEIFSIRSLRQLLAERKISSTELAQQQLDKAKAQQSQHNAFISFNEEAALSAAQHADQQIQLGENTPLLGIPMAHKDLFCTKNITTTCASKMLDNFKPPYNAAIVDKLASLGCVSLGKLNMDEFAMGATNETSYYGGVTNPWSNAHVSGGSSGGSAAAVALDLVPFATASDTGGSIRQPASFCGVTGIKPTYGRVSRYGMVAFASSLDQAGVIARSAEDCAIVLSAMSGHDERDSTSMSKPVLDFSTDLALPLKGLRIGVVTEFLSLVSDQRIVDCIETALNELQRLGATLHPVQLPNTHLVVPTYHILASAEASSNLARFDGVRFGYRCEQPKDLMDLYVRSRSEAFGAEVKRRIMVGTYVLSAGFYDAYYVKAQRLRRMVANDYQQVLSEVDVIIGATTPTTAYIKNAPKSSMAEEYNGDIFTIGANLAGMPAMSVPAGFVEGLPVGMQIIAAHWQEAKALRVAHQYQQVTDWHLQQAKNAGI